MTREKAQAQLAKLQALADPARGGTPAERATAKRKAAALMKRFGLEAPRPTPSRPRRPKFTAPIFGTPWEVDWEFNVQTAEHSPNVTVHHYQNPGNWRIEIHR